MPNEMQYDKVFEGLKKGKKSEVFSRILEMDSQGIPLSKMEGIIRDIIEGDLPVEINNNGKDNKEMKFVEKFMSENKGNKEYVEELIFMGHDTLEIAEIIRRDDTTETVN